MTNTKTAEKVRATTTTTATTMKITATAAILCVLVLTAFLPAVESVPQEEGGMFEKFTKIFKKLTGEGIQASCSAIPSMFDSIVPACLECEEGTWKIKSGKMNLGLLKCRKSKKAANGAGIFAGGVGAKPLTAAALIMLVLF